MLRSMLMVGVLASNAAALTWTAGITDSDQARALAAEQAREAAAEAAAQQAALAVAAERQAHDTFVLHQSSDLHSELREEEAREEKLKGETAAREMLDAGNGVSEDSLTDDQMATMESMLATEVQRVAASKHVRRSAAKSSSSEQDFEYDGHLKDLASAQIAVDDEASAPAKPKASASSSGSSSSASGAGAGAAGADGEGEKKAKKAKKAKKGPAKEKKATAEPSKKDMVKPKPLPNAVPGADNLVPAANLPPPKKEKDTRPKEVIKKKEPKKEKKEEKKEEEKEKKDKKEKKKEKKDKKDKKKVEGEDAGGEAAAGSEAASSASGQTTGSSSSGPGAADAADSAGSSAGSSPAGGSGSGSTGPAASPSASPSPNPGPTGEGVQAAGQQATQGLGGQQTTQQWPEQRPSMGVARSRNDPPVFRPERPPKDEFKPPPPPPPLPRGMKQTFSNSAPAPPAESSINSLPARDERSRLDDLRDAADNSFLAVGGVEDAPEDEASEHARIVHDVTKRLADEILARTNGDLLYSEAAKQGEAKKLADHQKKDAQDIRKKLLEREQAECVFCKLAVNLVPSFDKADEFCTKEKDRKLCLLTVDAVRTSFDKFKVGKTKADAKTDFKLGVYNVCRMCVETK